MQTKIEKKFILTDGSVTASGWRLLTEGCNINEFKKNPIGYYMSDRESGILLRWDEIRIEDGKITGKPVINMSHPRAQQTVDEINNGFLNASAIGHIIVIEVSNEEKYKLSGQTGFTVTKWFPRECSISDMGDNYNAVCLYSTTGTPFMQIVTGNEQKKYRELKTQLIHKNLISMTTQEIAEKLSTDELLKEAVKSKNITPEQAAIFKEQWDGQPDKLKPLLDEFAKLRLRFLMGLDWDELDKKDLLSELKEKFIAGYQMKYFLQFGYGPNEKKLSKNAKPAEYVNIDDLLAWAVENKYLDQVTAEGWKRNFGKDPEHLLKMVSDIPLTRLESLMQNSWDELDKDGLLDELKNISLASFREKFKSRFGVYPNDDTL
ncbi:MAG: hypothetical protein ABI921_00210 [Panacibacter sp.]